MEVPPYMTKKHITLQNKLDKIRKSILIKIIKVKIMSNTSAKGKFPGKNNSMRQWIVQTIIHNNKDNAGLCLSGNNTKNIRWK